MKRTSPRNEEAAAAEDAKVSRPHEEPDPTERFSRTPEFVDEHAEIEVLPPSEVGVPVMETEISDLALTQPLPRADVDDYDEEMIRTRELPVADDDWLQDLEVSDELPVRQRLPSRPGKETTGMFPHPAAARAAEAPPTVRTPQRDEAADRISAAYSRYYELCKARAQAVVGKDAFEKRLRERWERARKKYPGGNIDFRAVVENGTVRVRVVLTRKRARPRDRS